MTEIITNSNPIEVVLTTMPIEVVTNGVVNISMVLDDWENIQGKPETFPPSPHIQSIESITGLVEVLGEKEPADPTILKESAIGQTVQPYDADTNTFTDAEKTTLSTALQPPAIANFETSTQLNVRDAANRLWTNLTSVPAWITNATTFGQSLVTAASNTATKTLLALTKSDVGLGDVDNTSDASKPISTATQSALNLKAPLNNPTFTGTNLILPNNTRINGVEVFYQSTKPTVRGDGSPLVIGDRWYNPSSSYSWFWNGTYWLTEQFYEMEWNNGNNTQNYTLTNGALFPPSTTSLGIGKAIPFGFNNNIFVEAWTVRGYSSQTATLNSDNKFDLHVGIISLNTGAYIVTVDNVAKLFSPFPPAFGAQTRYPVNSVVNVAVNNPVGAFLYVNNVVGSPVLNTARLSWTYTLRGIAP